MTLIPEGWQAIQSVSLRQALDDNYLFLKNQSSLTKEEEIDLTP
jgi:hypothetical protein